MKYAIKRGFGIFRRLKPPFNSAVFRLALLMPKGVFDSKNISVEKMKIKSFDEKSFAIYIFRPKNCIEKLPAMVYFHGGGFVFKGSGCHFKTVKKYAEEAKIAVVYVDYRLAWQNIKAPLNDCVTAYDFILNNAEKLGFDGNKIGIGGDSAGGYLSLCVVKNCVERGISPPIFQLVVYPVVEKDMSSESMRKFYDTPMWNSKLNSKMWRLYALDNAFNPLIEELNFMPPTFIETAEFDCLHDEGVELYARLNRQGVRCELSETLGTMHGYDICFNSPTAQVARSKRIEFLKNTIGQL